MATKPPTSHLIVMDSFMQFREFTWIHHPIFPGVSDPLLALLLALGASTIYFCTQRFDPTPLLARFGSDPFTDPPVAWLGLNMLNLNEQLELPTTMGGSINGGYPFIAFDGFLLWKIPSFDSWMMTGGTPSWLRKPQYVNHLRFFLELDLPKSLPSPARNRTGNPSVPRTMFIWLVVGPPLWKILVSWDD